MWIIQQMLLVHSKHSLNAKSNMQHLRTQTAECMQNSLERYLSTACIPYKLEILNDYLSKDVSRAFNKRCSMTNQRTTTRNAPWWNQQLHKLRSRRNTFLNRIQQAFQECLETLIEVQPRNLSINILEGALLNMLLSKRSAHTNIESINGLEQE